MDSEVNYFRPCIKYISCSFNTLSRDDVFCVAMFKIAIGLVRFL